MDSDKSSVYLVDSRFDEVLGGQREVLASYAGAVYGLWPDLRLAFMNEAWFRFARANGAPDDFDRRWGLGSSLSDAIPPALREAYVERLESCLATGRPWSHEYECSSATMHRTFYQTVHSLKDGAGLLVVNALKVERAHSSSREVSEPSAELYRGESGLISQCAHCRMVKNPLEEDR